MNSSEMMKAIDQEKRNRLVERMSKLLRDGPNGSLGEGEKVHFGPDLQARYDINPFGRATLDGDGIVYHGGPKEYRDPVKEYPSQMDNGGLEMFKSWLSGKKVDLMRFWAHSAPPRVVESSTVYRLLEPYEVFLAQHFGPRLVLVNPSTATLYNVRGRLVDYVLRIEDAEERQRQRKKINAMGYVEMTDSPPDRVYYYGSHGLKRKDYELGIALVPNPYNSQFANDPDFTISEDKTGVDVSYVRRGRIRHSFLSIYPSCYRLAPHEVDHYAKVATEAFFLEMTFKEFSPLRIPYTPQGRRYSVALSDDSELDLDVNFLGVKGQSRDVVSVHRGVVVNVPGSGTWMGRANDRHAYAEVHGMGELDYSRHGPFYVCLNSTNIERSALVSHSGEGYSYVGPRTSGRYDSDFSVVVAERPINSLIREENKGCVWVLGNETGQVLQDLPGGSFFLIDWFGYDVLGMLTYYPSRQVFSGAYKWFFFSISDFNNYRLELAFELSHVYYSPLRLTISRSYEQEIERFAFENRENLTLGKLMIKFPNYSMGYLSHLLSSFDWIVPDNPSKEAVLQYRSIEQESHLVREVVAHLKYFRSVIVVNAAEIPPLVLQAFRDLGYFVGPYIGDPSMTSGGFIVVMTPSFMRDNRPKIVRYKPDLKDNPLVHDDTTDV